jgi:hypothetical protein
MDLDMTSLQIIDCCVPVGTPSLANDEAEATARVFKALGDPARVKILSLVAAADEPARAQPGDGQPSPEAADRDRPAGPRAARKVGLLLAQR